MFAVPMPTSFQPTFFFQKSKQNKNQKTSSQQNKKKEEENHVLKKRNWMAIPEKQHPFLVEKVAISRQTEKNPKHQRPSWKMITTALLEKRPQKDLLFFAFF